VQHLRDGLRRQRLADAGRAVQEEHAAAALALDDVVGVAVAAEAHQRADELLPLLGEHQLVEGPVLEPDRAQPGHEHVPPRLGREAETDHGRPAVGQQVVGHRAQQRQGLVGGAAAAGAGLRVEPAAVAGGELDHGVGGLVVALRGVVPQRRAARRVHHDAPARSEQAASRPRERAAAARTRGGVDEEGVGRVGEELRAAQAELGVAAAALNHGAAVRWVERDVRELGERPIAHAHPATEHLGEADDGEVLAHCGDELHREMEALLHPEQRPVLFVVVFHNHEGSRCSTERNLPLNCSKRTIKLAQSVKNNHPPSNDFLRCTNLVAVDLLDFFDQGVQSNNHNGLLWIFDRETHA
jgi:hypothetical protein